MRGGATVKVHCGVQGDSRDARRICKSPVRMLLHSPVPPATAGESLQTVRDKVRELPVGLTGGRLWEFCKRIQGTLVPVMYRS